MEIHSNELQTDESRTYRHYGGEYNSCKQIPNSNNGACICRQLEKWTSPSDLIVDMVGLKPPFTSKVIKSKAHVGIQSIGETYLEIEKDFFHESIIKALKDNEDTWKFILKNEIKSLHKKVKDIFKDIFEQKRTILVNEMSSFYENTLYELEEHIKSELKTISFSFQNGLTDQLNRKIEKKLILEKEDLEKKLNEELNAKINKIKKYYDLLLKNEVCRYSDLKNKVIQERNDAVKSFCRQMESERLTSNIYVLSSERKKCKVKKMLLENIQYSEIMDHLKILMGKDDLLKDLDEQKQTLPILNKQFQEQVVKILRLFLKFTSFSLKLLPEQTTFLLDFEKMVILQLNEFQKQPYNPPQILVNIEDQNSMFEFHELQSVPSVCDKKPFQIVGSIESPFSLFFNYGSRETIGSKADYPYFRVQRKHIYAKCHGFEKIKDMLGTNICRCASKEVENILSPVSSFEKKENLDSKVNLSEISSKSSSIHMGPDFKKVNTIKECPNDCGKSIQKYDFPELNSFLDYNEKNFEKLTSSIDIQEPELIRPTKVKDIVFSDIPFPAVHVEEDFRTVATQCSSQDDVDYKKSVCECTTTDNCDNSFKGCKVHDVFLKRELSLKKLLQTDPMLFSILFSDESYEYKV